jgi:hypothetical protein
MIFFACFFLAIGGQHICSNRRTKKKNFPERYRAKSLGFSELNFSFFLRHVISTNRESRLGKFTKKKKKEKIPEEVTPF